VRLKSRANKRIRSAFTRLFFQQNVSVLNVVSIVKRSFMRSDSIRGDIGDSEWATFIAKLEAAEHEFAQGRPAAFKALWSHSDEVSICGAFGGIESGWKNVAARLDWASSQFSEGTRSREEIRSAIGTDFAYVVQTEHIRFRVPGRMEQSTLDLRVTMVFRRQTDGWRIVHRQADSQKNTQLPCCPPP
jgi:hypothetical protein